MKTSWLYRLLAMTTLLGWLGAAYHDVWLTAAEMAHEHHHAHHQHDHESGSTSKDSNNTTLLPDFHNVAHLTKDEQHANNVSLQLAYTLAPILWVVSLDDSIQASDHPPPRDHDDGLLRQPLELFLHSVGPNAPPMTA